MTQSINVGDTLTCAETGKQFVAAQSGCSFNYATGPAGEIVSDEGVDIRERRELLDRSKPFGCYCSQNMDCITGWKGNILGKITHSSKTRVRCNMGGYWYSVRARDVHGRMWHGRGAPGMFISIRPCA